MFESEGSPASRPEKVLTPVPPRFPDKTHGRVDIHCSYSAELGLLLAKTGGSLLGCRRCLRCDQQHRAVVNVRVERGDQVGPVGDG